MFIDIPSNISMQALWHRMHLSLTWNCVNSCLVELGENIPSKAASAMYRSMRWSKLCTFIL